MRSLPVVPRRCAWCGDDPLYVAYHDREWGFPVADDRRLFEKICLEGFQSGLSWLTILRKRDAFRDAFLGFDFERVARMGARDVQRLLGNAGDRSPSRQDRVDDQQREARARDQGRAWFAGGLLLAYEPAPSTRPQEAHAEALRTMAISPESVALAKDLKRRGWAFVGPTTVYAFMQAMGLVNDHVHDCDSRAAATRARSGFKLPR